MTISVKTYSKGEILYADDLNAHLATIVDEINRLAALPHQDTKNLIINGDFQVWQRGTSQTSSGYGSDDRWKNVHTGSTKVASQQTHTLGSSSPTDKPKYYARTVVTSVAGAGNFVIKAHKIEGVAKSSGETVTLSFWAKADTTKDIAVELTQEFGTGGSPSSTITEIGVTTFSLSTSWTKYTTTISVPGISGKTLGTNGDDLTSINFWLEAGSDFDSRTNTLGQQSGTFDISNVQLEISDVATDFEFVHPADQLARCQRYFERLDSGLGGTPIASGQCESTTILDTVLRYELKRIAPTISVSSNTGFSALVAGTNKTSTAMSSALISPRSALLKLTTSGLTAGEGGSININASEYIDIDAEL